MTVILSVPSVIVGVVVQVAGREISLGTLQAIFVMGLIIGVATIIPTFALTVRRLHDANFSGLFLLLGFVPFIGGLIVTILLLMPDREEGSRFDW